MKEAICSGPRKPSEIASIFFENNHAKTKIKYAKMEHYVRILMI
jgi:hypothetical protein